MAHILRPKYTCRHTGERKTAAAFAIDFRFGGRRRRLSASTNRTVAESYLRLIETLLESRRFGAALSPDVLKRLRNVAPERLATLERIGLIDRVEEPIVKGLAELIADYRSYQQYNLACSSRHIREVFRILNTILIEGCGFGSCTDISLSSVEARLRERQSAGSIGAQRYNNIATMLKAFAGWLVKREFLDHSPLTHLTRLNVDVDRRRVPRALTVDEQRTLIACTAKGPVHFGMTGAERALVYETAIQTGLRAGELRSLTKKSFNFQATPAFTIVEAVNSKRRREDTIFLRPALADKLRHFLRRRCHGDKAFGIPPSDRISKIFHRDREAAGLPYLERGKCLTFHSLL